LAGALAAGVWAHKARPRSDTLKTDTKVLMMPA
jgi:hypothetical protein